MLERSMLIPFLAAPFLAATVALHDGPDPIGSWDLNQVQAQG